MLGAIIGDIAGSAFEFNPTNHYDFPFLCEECGFTDDTICTIGVAEAILDCKGNTTVEDYSRSVQRWCRKYPDPMGGYGGRFAIWVNSALRTPYGSFGNGSAMRVSPVGLFFTSESEVLEEAKKTALISHNHPEGIKGAQTIALLIHKAKELKKKGKAMNPETISSMIQECVDFSGYNLNFDLESKKNLFDETCMGTVPVALKIIGMSNGFEDSLRRAVSLGADADTLGAIVGSVAEVIWGIPEDISRKAKQFLPSEMQKVVARFYSIL